MAKAQIVEVNGVPDLASVADQLGEALAIATEVAPGEFAPDVKVRKKPGRKPGSGAKRTGLQAPGSERSQAVDPVATAEEEIAQYAALYEVIMPGLSRIISAKLGEGIGWTPEEIKEAAPIFGRVCHKWLGATAYSDEIALATAIVAAPLLRLMARGRVSSEKMPAPPQYAPEARDN